MDDLLREMIALGHARHIAHWLPIMLHLEEHKLRGQFLTIGPDCSVGQMIPIWSNTERTYR